MCNPSFSINIKKLFLVTGMILFACNIFYAQTFPVNVTPQVIPPYSLKLSEYSTSFSDKLILNLLLTDITESNRQVYLKFYVENNAGLNIQSSDVVMGATPIFLDGGIPLRLSNIDLQAYFEFQNLKGITPQQYSVPLPEGLYRFCFEVYDAQSGQQISRKSCATVYLVLNDPPFLNIPNRGEQVLMRETQNIIFQWTPRHLNATNVEYEFTLAELWDTQMDPQAAFLASRPLYQTNTFSTTLLYGPGETSLLPDKTYAWRVRAIVNDGISETSVFKNNGYSEIYHFTYTGSCAEPEYVLAEAKNTTTEKILWQGVDHKRFNVQYRKKGADNSLWFDSPTVNSYTTIYNLEPGTSYQFRVGGQCMDNGSFTYSQIFEFTTNISTDQGSNFNCGITPEIVIHNQDPLASMVINETFTAGDFPVTVKEVNGANGTFSGWGYIVVPYLEDTRLKVSFDNIRINTEYQLMEGIVVTDYDENWGGVDDIGDEIDALLSLGDWLEVFEEAANALIDNFKDKVDTEIMTNAYIKLVKEILADPDNGLTNEEIERQTAFIENRGKVKEAIKQAKEFFESGKGEDYIKENLASNFTDQQNPNGTDLFTQYIKNKLKELKKKTGHAAYAIIHCENGCNDDDDDDDDDNNNESNYNYSEIIDATNNLKTILDGKKYDTNLFNTQNTLEFKLQFAEKGGQKCMIIYYQYKTNDNVNAILDSSNTEIDDNSKKLLFITKEKTFDCYNYLSSWNSELCSYTSQNIFANDASPYFEKLFETILSCVDGEKNTTLVSLDKIEKILIDANKSKRSNQSIEYAYNDNVYRIGTDGKVEKIEHPLSDTKINEGKWDDAPDIKIRLTHNNNGFLQYKALGINEKLKLSIGKTANLKEIALKIKASTNIFFENNKVTTVNITPIQLGVSLNNNGQIFADGKKLEINENSAFWKISTESLGLLTSLLKTSEIEEKTYLESTEHTATIHAPGLVTGGVEVVAQKVTDLTSLCVQVTNLALNEKARDEMYNQFSQIKTQIGEDPKTFFPILVDVTIAATTGNSAEEWKETLSKETDTGKRNHKVTFGTGNAVITVMAGAAIVKDLPEIVAKLGEKIDDILKIGNKVFKSADEFADALYKARNTIRKKIIDLSETKDLAKEFFENIKKSDLSLREMNFEDWYANTFKKYDLKGELVNFEAHHIIPADVLNNNDKFKELLFELRKTDPDFNFDFNSIDNGIMVQKKSIKLENNGHTSHKQYNDAISDKITEIITSSNKPQRAMDEIQDLIKTTKETLKKEVLLGNKDVNDIISF